MKMGTIALVAVLSVSIGRAQAAERFTCPAGSEDMMKYFAMAQSRRANQYMKGSANSIYTEVVPDTDFDAYGYWFWLKSASGHGFDVKAYNPERIFMRSTELTWTDNTSFKRFQQDLPIAERCVPHGQPGHEIRTPHTEFSYYKSCKPYKSSNLGTAVNNLDAPQLIDVGGSLGQQWTRVLHYRYNCDGRFENCADEEQFFLANGYGLWQWKHFKNGSLVKSTLMNELGTGTATKGLPCPESYDPAQ
jgi:hypothetical protein